MKLNNIINTKRLLLVLKRDIFVNLKTYLITFGVIFGFFFIAYIISFLRNTVISSNMTLTADELVDNFRTGFFIIGIVISGIAFSDFRSKLKTQNFLLIPASTAEKFLSAWGITTIIYIIVYSLVFVVFNLLLIIIGKFFSVPVGFLNIFSGIELFNYIGMYLIIQSIFLAGAATFTKSPLLKTPLVGFAVSIVFSIFISMAGFAIFHTFHMEFNSNLGFNPDINTDLLKTFGKIFLYITPFVFWAITFFKLKEKQV